jgi:hypothetical protein
VGVVVEEPEKFVLKLGEFLLAGEASVVFHVVVQEVDGLGFEESSQLGVLVDYVSQMDFVDVGVVGAVSQPGPEEHPREKRQPLESEGQVPELVEEE